MLMCCNASCFRCNMSFKCTFFLIYTHKQKGGKPLHFFFYEKVDEVISVLQ